MAGDVDAIWSSTGKVTVNGGTVTATGGEKDDGGCGIHSSKELIISGGTVNASGTEAGLESAKSSVNISGGNVKASGSNQAIKGTVKNDISGIGWTDLQGKEGKADIEVNTEGQDLKVYKLVQFKKGTDGTVPR